MSREATARLDRLLANLGYGSRREVRALIADGTVTVDGAPGAADLRVTLAPGLSERVRVAGAPLDPPPPLTLILHKPLGVVCSRRETGRIIYDLLPPRWRARDPALSTIGRLDKETSGLLLMTDDGGLLHRIISPKATIAKSYLVTLERPLTGEEGPLFARGDMVLPGDDTPLLPAELEPLSADQCRLTIVEGRYHQVRRMFSAIGNTVVALHRDRIGKLDLPTDLAPGAFRPLTDAEQALVFNRF